MSEVLEQLIDKNGLSTVLEVMADVCHAKADHILTNWQDDGLAKVWEECGTKLSLVADSLPKTH